MDKKKLGIKLKKETSATGTGASVTPGVGMGVATKYAFKKKVKEDAPQLAAGKVKDNYAVSHFGFTDAPSVPNRKSKAIDYKELWEEAGTDEVVAVLNNPNLDPDVKKTLMSAYRQKHITADGVMAIVDLVLKKGSINEGYAQFRNATKMRSKPDQFHQAVKEIKKKMNEINRIFEYVDRLKTELSEGEDLKYKKYTENAFQQIKENAKALFLKSTKLK